MPRPRKYRPPDFRSPCPACGALCPGALLVTAAGTRGAVRCEEHGVVMGKPEAKRKRSSMGWAVVVPYLAFVDEHPETLAAGLPVFTQEEWDLLPRRPEPERKRVWRERTTAIAREHEQRQRDPARSIAGPGPQAPQTPQESPGEGDW